MTDHDRHPEPTLRYIKRFTHVDDLGYAPGPLFELHGQYGRYVLVLQQLCTSGWIDVPTEDIPEQDLLGDDVST